MTPSPTAARGGRTFGRAPCRATEKAAGNLDRSPDLRPEDEERRGGDDNFDDAFKREVGRGPCAGGLRRWWGACGQGA